MRRSVGDLEELGESFDHAPDSGSRDVADRLVRRFFWLCESPMTRARTLRIVEASVSDRESAQRFYAFLNKRTTGLLGRRMKTSASRMELVGGQLIGTAMLRYVLKVEPVASMSLDELQPLVAAGVRGILTAEPGSDPAGLPEAVSGPEGTPDAMETVVQMKATGRTF